MYEAQTDRSYWENHPYAGYLTSPCSSWRGGAVANGEAERSRKAELCCTSRNIGRTAYGLKGFDSDWCSDVESFDKEDDLDAEKDDDMNNFRGGGRGMLFHVCGLTYMWKCWQFVRIIGLHYCLFLFTNQVDHSSSITNIIRSKNMHEYFQAVIMTYSKWYEYYLEFHFSNHGNLLLYVIR